MIYLVCIVLVVNTTQPKIFNQEVPIKPMEVSLYLMNHI
jgi:hypothetical protein